LMHFIKLRNSFIHLLFKMLSKKSQNLSPLCPPRPSSPLVQPGALLRLDPPKAGQLGPQPLQTTRTGRQISHPARVYRSFVDGAGLLTPTARRGR
jgi:hypothetical protein